MFKLRVDTGGTFTDCWALADDEDAPRLAKVLSSGRLRVPVAKWSAPHRLTVDLPDAWRTKDAFFTGYKLTSEHETALVISFDASQNELTLSRPLPQAGAVDLFTGEEAPVLGARLLTGTALDEAFPPLDFRLATTRGTNALLERKGAKVAFFTTEGFADLLVIRDQRRSDLFALKPDRPAPVFDSVVEVAGRLNAAGSEVSPLVLDEAFDDRVRALIDTGIAVAAVSLLHGWVNPAHEEAVAQRLRELGFSHVSTSAGLAPLIKFLPRAETSVVNAYLQPIMQQFIDHISERLDHQGDQDKQGSRLMMTSAGGLEPIDQFAPKDSLLSGPAGGVSGAAAVAQSLSYERIITFDMGGTSTDVARYDGAFRYHFEQTVGDARLLSPALKIETVASGGGSICAWKNGGLEVGPESAGADPGPACYGRGGPLTITDVNLLLGRIDPENFGIPLTEENIEAAQTAARALQAEAGLDSESVDPEFLNGLLEIATEQMADAIRSISVRDGADPSDYTLLAFGGAGPLHACDIAERLDIDTVLIPAEAGVLSALGLDQASIERFAERQIDRPSSDPALRGIFEAVEQEASNALAAVGFEGGITQRLAEVRLQGQDSTLSIRLTGNTSLEETFLTEYQSTFGYAPTTDHPIQVASYRAIAGTGREAHAPIRMPSGEKSTGSTQSSNPVEWIDREGLAASQVVEGPAIVQDPFSTFYLKPAWTTHVSDNGALVATRCKRDAASIAARPPQIVHELFRHRFDQLVVEMGTMLQRSAISTNVKERADFSCALLDGSGELITSAPHIPVHLGALGVCVRMVRPLFELQPGDTIITNHPAYGGSHLPDVTLITPVFEEDGGAPCAFIANRAHHAEIGGIVPGSMPPNARMLSEEGVVISPTLLVKKGQVCLDAIESLLTAATYPTRNVTDNLADLNAQLAANLRGVDLFQKLLKQHGAPLVTSEMQHLKQRCQQALAAKLKTTPPCSKQACERLDDGHKIAVAVSCDETRIRIDFSGTSATHPRNFNATPAIVQSAILYVLRLWTQTDVPLNEGIFSSIDLRLPECFLNPTFIDDPTRCPPVVGGNVETSQRIVDALIRAFGIQAGSQGTMNNFLFGNERFGYYETIGGGTGAGEGYHGTSAIHSHMTNTAITDPEILEHRYPVRLRQFSIRANSGGKGKWNGGDGICREIEFLEPLQISLLTQHRLESPFGGQGGEDGKSGAQFLNGKPLASCAQIEVEAGDILKIETPGGGGWGSAG